VLVENLLDDMFKLFLDPVFKPKHVNEPDRENLFELIYSQGGTPNSKEKVNQRREYTWDDLYISEEIKEEFMKHRFKSSADRFKKNKIHRSNHRSPGKEVTRRSVTVRDDTSHNNSIQLYSAYNFDK